MSLQKEIINTIQSQLGSDFIAGYLIYEGVQADMNSFKFVEADPNNKFSVQENTYVPVQYSSFIGKIQPVESVYDEDGTVRLEFMIKVDDKFASRFEAIEDCKRGLIGNRGSFTYNTKQYYYAFNSSPIDSTEPPLLLNGARYVKVSLTVFYRLSTVEMGNSIAYYVRPNYIESQDIGSQPNLTAELKSALIEEVEGYDIEETRKELILSDLQNDIELNTEDKTLLVELRVENSFEKLERVSVELNVGKVLDPSQTINTKEITNFLKNRSFGNTLTFYRSQGNFNNVLEQMEAGEEEENKIFVLRRKIGEENKERQVLIEAVTPNYDLGKPIKKTVTFRTPAPLLVEREVAEKQAEFPEQPLVFFDISYDLLMGTVNGIEQFAGNNSSNASQYTTEEAVFFLDPFTSSGYTFVEWLDVTDPQNPQTITQLPEGSSGDKDIKISVTPNDFTVTFINNYDGLSGGTGTVTATQGEIMPAFEGPSPTTVNPVANVTIEFKGYYANASGGQFTEEFKYYDESMTPLKEASFDITRLDARWVQV